jgi:hypothetical protein
MLELVLHTALARCVLCRAMLWVLPPPAACCQVHRAVLHSGEAVVVKVQRPGLKQLFDIDLVSYLGDLEEVC